MRWLHGICRKPYVFGFLLLLLLGIVWADQRFWGTFDEGAVVAEEARLLCESAGKQVPLRSFSTDGCSLWPNGAWVDACIAHDYVYWCGGTQEERKAADEQLRRGVNDIVPLFGTVMYVGVRIGGHPCLPFPWRWGYGYAWKACLKGY